VLAKSARVVALDSATPRPSFVGTRTQASPTMHFHSSAFGRFCGGGIRLCKRAKRGFNHYKKKRPDACCASSRTALLSRPLGYDECSGVRLCSPFSVEALDILCLSTGKEHSNVCCVLVQKSFLYSSHIYDRQDNQSVVFQPLAHICNVDRLG
jgi:hypothetical protein